LTERQLHCIIEIAKAGNITVAAQKLYISQPSLSSLLAHVEEELGAKLFDRSTSSMVLTYAGEKYIEAAEKILLTIAEMQNQINDIGESRIGRLRIGCGPQHSPIVLPSILTYMIERYPKVEFQITEGYGSLLESDLLSGKLDVLIYGGIIDHPLLKCEKIAEREYVLIAPCGFKAALLPVSKKGPLPCINLRSVEDKNFVLMKSGHQLRTMQDHIFHDLNFKPRIILETEILQTILRMVESGIAFSVLPYVDALFKESLFDKYSFEKDYYHQIYLCYRKNAYISKLMNDFIDTVHRLFLDNKW